MAPGEKDSVELRLRAGVALSDAPVVLGTVEVADVEAPGGGGPARGGGLERRARRVAGPMRSRPGSSQPVRVSRWLAARGGPALVLAEAPLQGTVGGRRRPPEAPGGGGPAPEAVVSSGGLAVMAAPC